LSEVCSWSSSTSVTSRRPLHWGLVPQTILERPIGVLLSDEELYRFRVVKLSERVQTHFAEILEDEPKWAGSLSSCRSSLTSGR
jgi:hypothetical protein